MKCVNCKYCIGMDETMSYYICKVEKDWLEAIDECIANDDEMLCDFYVNNRNDDTAA